MYMIFIYVSLKDARVVVRLWLANLHGISRTGKERFHVDHCGMQAESLAELLL